MCVSFLTLIKVNRSTYIVKRDVLKKMRHRGAMMLLHPNKKNEETNIAKREDRDQSQDSAIFVVLLLYH